MSGLVWAGSCGRGRVGGVVWAGSYGRGRVGGNLWPGFCGPIPWMRRKHVCALNFVRLDQSRRTVSFSCTKTHQPGGRCKIELFPIGTQFHCSAYVKTLDTSYIRCFFSHRKVQEQACRERAARVFLGRDQTGVRLGGGDEGI